MSATTLSLSIKYGVNSKLLMSPSEFLDRYLFGVPLCTKDGRQLNMQVIADKILAAQESMENFLQIKLFPQIQFEQRQFIRDEYKSWGYLKMSYPIKKMYLLEGMLGTTRQIIYPSSWCSIAQPNNEKALSRDLALVPVGAQNAQTNSVVYAGITPHLGFMYMDNMPNYWSVAYATGFDNVPMDIYDAIGKLAAIQVLMLLGDLFLGLGMASQSISIDGLSQSISSTKTQGAGIFGARINEYTKQLAVDMPNLRSYYRGIMFSAF